LKLLREIAPTYQSVNDLESEEDEAHFCASLQEDASNECIAILH
jgi:hypothetical protein